MSSNTTLVRLFETYAQNENENIRQTAIQCLQIIQIAPNHDKEEFSQESALGISNVLMCSLSYSFDQMIGSSKADDFKLILRHIRFIDEVASESPVIVLQILGKAFEVNFLENSLKPEIFKKSSQEVCKATFYLESFIGALNHPMLIKSIVEFILSTLIKMLISRLSHPASSVTAATLKLFNTLFELYCEDIWYDLVLKYLMTQEHIMVSHRGESIKKLDFEESSLRFLHFVPLRISESLGQVVTDEFLSYINAEARRCADLNNIQDMTSNFRLPSWKFKYDGTDDRSEIESDEFQYTILIDSYNSSSSSVVKGSFGPFLDALFKLLKNWKKCTPGVALGLTQVMSTLAGSRIPIISSLLLDPNIILQPAFSHCSFSALLTQITNEIEDKLRNVPQEYISYVWDYLKQNLPVEGLESEEAMRTKEMKIISDREDNSLMTSLSSSFGGPNSFKSMGRSIKKSFFDAIFQSVATEEIDLSIQMNLGKENSRQITFKGIIYYNWLLELAAIANQACWLRSFSQEQSKNYTDTN